MSKLKTFQKTTITQRSRLTMKVLRCISQHLSGKDACRGEVYRVAIGMYDEKQQMCNELKADSQFSFNSAVFFEPPVLTMIHHRGTTIHEHVIQHVIKHHFPDLWTGECNNTMVTIYTEQLVPGIYEYRPSVNNKNRSWTIVKLPE